MLACSLCLAFAGCAQRPASLSPEPAPVAPPSETDLASLRARVSADPYDGVSRNNLGVALLSTGDLGEAASQFDQASKLLPGRPDPRLNLGLAFERAGRLNDALAAYQSAHDADLDCMPATQALARTRLLLNQPGEDLDSLLKDIAMRGQTSAWREWAQSLLRQRAK